MPPTVPPAPPPAIIQPSQSENSVPSATVAAAAKVLATPTPPETLAAEPTFVTPVSGAAALGKPMSVGYPLQGQNTSVTSSSPVIVAPPPQNTDTPALDAPQNLTSQATPKLPPQNTDTPAQQTPLQITIPTTPATPTQESEPLPTTPPKPQPATTNQPQSQPPATVPLPNTGAVRERIIELTSDRQEYDEVRRVVTAEGRVLLRFDGAVLDADRLQVNLDNLVAVGEGNVALTRGGQVVRGARFTYNFIQDSGDLQQGSGEIFLPTAGTDFAFGLPTDLTAGGVPPRPQSDRIRQSQPLQNVGSPGGINIVVGGTRNVGTAFPKGGGEVRRIRFQAENIDFNPQGWQANNVRLTNDPFSPPELELRANRVTLTRETPLRDRIKTQGQRLVLDQRTTIGIPRDEQVIDRSERDVTPGLFSVGYDGDQRGGLFIERRFSPIDRENFRFSVTPQFFAQKAVSNNDGFASLFGLRSKLDATLGPNTQVEGAANLTSFDFGELDENLRASLRLRQRLGDTTPHILSLEYTYRNRLYNGTLGYQTVQSSIGGLIQSPVIPLGNSGVNLSYQASAQYINADTDRLALLDPIRDNNRTSLGRFQASAALSRGFLLWQGKPLPPTATEGLRYTPNPVVPYLAAVTGLTGTTGYYSNGDSQSTLTGTIGLQGQIGHSARDFLDYTNFNINYSQSLNSGLSPFLFDRVVDTRVLSAGVTQQIYGPLRLGFQTVLNLDTGKSSSTDYFLEYSRRTHGVTLRYNPVLELGSISFRISDFNWSGGTNPFSEVGSVRGGVPGENNE